MINIILLIKLCFFLRLRCKTMLQKSGKNIFCSHWSSFSALGIFRHILNNFISVTSVACRSETPVQVCFSAFPISLAFESAYLEKSVSLLSMAWSQFPLHSTGEWGLMRHHIFFLWTCCFLNSSLEMIHIV